MQNGESSIPLDSKIINNLEEIEFIEKEMKRLDSSKKNKNLRLELFYRMSRDGKEDKNFFDLCEGITDNLIVIKTTRGYRFGGISYSPWHNGKYVNDWKSFCFSLDYKKIYNAKENVVTHQTNGLPYFFGSRPGPGCDEQMIRIFNSRKGNIFGKCGLKGNNVFIGQEKDYEINGGFSTFDILEWEAFKIRFT